MKKKINCNHLPLCIRAPEDMSYHQLRTEKTNEKKQSECHSV